MQFFCIFSQIFTALFVCFGTTIFYSYLSSFCNTFYLIGKILFFFEHISKSSKNNNNTSFITFSRLITLCTHLVWMRIASLYTTSGYVVSCIVQNCVPDSKRLQAHVQNFVHAHEAFTVGYKTFVHAPEAFTVGYKSFVHAPEAFTVGYKILYTSVAKIR